MVHRKLLWTHGKQFVFRWKSHGLCGDFGQCLAVVKYHNTVDVLENSVKRTGFWLPVQTITLYSKIHIWSEELDFAQRLLKVGSDILNFSRDVTEFFGNFIKIPNDIIINNIW